MKVSLKNTLRRDIPKNAININVIKKELAIEEEIITFPSISFFEIKGFEHNLKVVLKVKQQRQVEILDCGTVGNIRLPTGEPLKSFTDSSLKLYISVHILDPVSQKIHSSTKSPLKIIILEEELNSRSPIGVSFGITEPFLWKLEELHEYDTPVVTFSEKIINRRKTETDPLILTSIFPSIVEKLLLFIWDGQHQDHDEFWIEYWRKMSSQLGMKWMDSHMNSSDPEEQGRWVEQYVEAWMQKNKNILIDKAIAGLNHEIEESYEGGIL